MLGKDSFFGYEELLMINDETDEVLIHFEWTYPYDVKIPSSNVAFELSVTFLLDTNLYYKFIFNPINVDEFIVSEDYLSINMENLNDEIKDFKNIYEQSVLLNQLKGLDNVTYTFSKEFGCSDILICCLNNISRVKASKKVKESLGIDSSISSYTYLFVKDLNLD